MTPSSSDQAGARFRAMLLDDVIPFWIEHGWDREHGGMMTCLDRDGSLVDSDKSVWFQGRSCWMFATLYNTVAPDPLWLEVAQSCADFLDAHGSQEIDLSQQLHAHPQAPIPKLYFSLTRDGRPLRMRRYYYSESFASIAYAAMAKATKKEHYRTAAIRMLEVFLRSFLEPGLVPPKSDPRTRPMRGIGPWMIALATAQELRANLGDVPVHSRTCTEWIERCIQEIESVFYKPDHAVLMEVVGPEGEIIDHQEGRQLNPGHAIECAWFVLHEAKHRNDPKLIQLGTAILDAMWERGWDSEYGGLFYFRDLYGKPVQEYWHDMKFWWPHCEAIIATQLAADLTREDRYIRWHEQGWTWSTEHFSDPEYGEWYGYLHRDGRLSNTLKGSIWKGPFHLPRMLWYCSGYPSREPSSNIAPIDAR